MDRFRFALQEAWWAFRMALRGWRIASWNLPVHPEYGRSVGAVHRNLPVYPGWQDPRGWRLGSEGTSWNVTHASPLDAIAPSAPGMSRVLRRFVEVSAEIQAQVHRKAQKQEEVPRG